MKIQALFLAIALLMGSSVFADKKNGLMRGGLGLIYGDASSFNNGGQLAQNRGTALSARYLKNESGWQTGAPSFIWANGKAAFGGYVARTGGKLDSATDSSDTMGLTGGLGFAGDKATVGFTYDRSIDGTQSGDGTIAGQLSVHLGKSDGLSLGAEYSTTVGSDSGGELRTATLGMGYRFNATNYMEAAYIMDNMDDSANNHTITGTLRVGGQSFYVAGLYGMVTTIVDTSNYATGRMGIIADSFDIYLEYSKFLITGAQATYGGAMRLAF